MKKFCKLIISSVLVGLTVFSLCGCKDHKKKTVYQSYVKDVLDVNYKGDFSGYIKNEDGKKTDATNMHQECISALADQLITHYSLNNAVNVEIKETYTYLAEKIYAKSKYKVSEAYTKDGNYYVDVTISPINILNDAYEDILTYINDFNSDVSSGVYNDYTKEEYEATFALGISNILAKWCDNPSYDKNIVVSVPITDDGEFYSMDSSALTDIDSSIIALEKSVSDEAAPADGEAAPADGEAAPADGEAAPALIE